MKRRHLAVRMTAAFLAVLLLCSQALASEALGWDLLQQTTTVGQEATVTDSNFWSDTYSTLRTEHYLTYTPNSGVTTVVSFGSGIYTRSTLSSMAAALEAQGYRVLAGVNGDFFDLDSGVPLGLVVTDGVLRSSASYCYAVGFMEDGSAFIGQPQLKITATFLGYSLLLAGVNKVRTETGGYYLYTEDFGASTLNTSAGLDVILTPVTEEQSDAGVSDTTASTSDPAESDTTEDNTVQNSDVSADTAAEESSGLDTDSTDTGDTAEDSAAALNSSDQLTIGGQVTCRVTAIRESTDSSEIPEGSFVLSINYNSHAWLVSQLQSLVVGDTVVIGITCEDERWTQVTSAVGGLYRLVTDGTVDSSLDTITDAQAQSQAPRTAIGVKADGSVVFYTIDGREYGYSVGATMKQAAKRLLELGCVNAVCLDGGGSTTFGTTSPNEDTTSVINSPSDGSERKVANAVFLVSRLTATGILGSIYVEAGEALLLPGASSQLTVSGVDTAYYPMAIGAVTWSAEGGSINESGVFVAGDTEGDAVITATSEDGEGNSVAGGTMIRVITTPTAVTVSNEGTKQTVTSLTLEAGAQINLTASATWNTMAVKGGDTCFTWTADASIGTIDANGVFTAGQEAGTGNVTVTAGEKTVTIPVTVKKSSPFVDTSGSWAEDYIIKLYELGITTGVDSGSGLCYYPGKNITRGEFFLMTARWLGIDVTQYADTVLPFADTDQIASWALNGVKAMYALGVLTGSEENGLLYAKTDDTITRAEAMTILGRTLEETVTCDLSAYGDAASVPDWALSYVQTLVTMGVINGDEKGNINPNADLTRAEVSKILVVMREMNQNSQQADQQADQQTDQQADQQMDQQADQQTDQQTDQQADQTEQQAEQQTET